MTSGPGDGEKPQGEGQGEAPKQRESGGTLRSTPPPGRRTPPPRRRSGGRSVEHRGGPEKPSSSVFGRVFGRQGLDAALQERFNPYDYESTRPMLRWLFLALLAFLAAASFALFADWQFRSQLNEWNDQGLTEIPIDNEEVSAASLVIAALTPELNTAEALCGAERDAISAVPTVDPTDPDATPGPTITVRNTVLNQACNSMDRVFEHAETAGIDCTTPEQFATVVRGEAVEHPGCQQLIETSERYDTLETGTLISTVLLVFAIIIAAFPFSTFAHRSSRNLRTLKAQGQKHSPDGTVIRFFVPIINIYKPLIMFNELFKGSDPRHETSDPAQWQKRGIVSPIAVLWGLTWGAVVVFNPITVQLFIFNTREDLSDVSRNITALIASDILLVSLGILAILMANTLSRWQDRKASKYGTITVTPPRPRDPLEKALEEGVRRADKERQANRERRSKSRRKKK